MQNVAMLSLALFVVMLSVVLINVKARKTYCTLFAINLQDSIMFTLRSKAK